MQNGSEVKIPCAPRRSVYIVGDAAMQPPKRGARVHGVLVQRGKHGDPQVMAPSDLGLYNKVSVGRVVQRQVMRLGVDFGRCRLALEMLFEGIDAAQSLGGIECVDGDGASSSTCLSYALLSNRTRLRLQAGDCCAHVCCNATRALRKLWLSHMRDLQSRARWSLQ